MKRHSSSGGVGEGGFGIRRGSPEVCSARSGEQFRLAVEIRHVEARQRIARERIADVHRAVLVGEHQHRRGERLSDRSDLEQSVGLGRAVVFGVTVEALRARLAFAWRRSQGRRMAATLARPPDR